MNAHRHEVDAPRGFTLVELLVVIAIIGVLVALLLPAVQAAREAARRAQCQSTIKNIALAVLNFESAKEELPVGFVSQAGEVEAWSWSTFTLPYLEQQALYDRLRPSTTYVMPPDGTRSGKRNLCDVFIAAKSNPKELEPLQTPLSIFRCPSDDTPDTVPFDDTPRFPRTDDSGKWERHFDGLYSGQLTPQFTPSTSNYVGSRGFVDVACRSLNGNDQATNWVGDPEKCEGNGVFAGLVPVELKQITDGTSSTFLLGERDSFCLAGTWIGIRNPPGANMWGVGWILGRVSLTLNHPETGDHDTCTEGFSSRHPGGGNFAFCDGSVTFISEDIEYEDADNYHDVALKHFQPVKNGKTLGAYQRLGVRNDELGMGR
jgi:prepilin-type N-terminal cleavage/methylation domain-containing protein/prepilin-type processing-associated H-X9-DG protein